MEIRLVLRIGNTQDLGVEPWAVLGGEIVEKGGVNISTVSGQFSEEMRQRIPGAKKDPQYWATGISVVIHPTSPHIPSMHFNSRFLKPLKPGLEAV